MSSSFNSERVGTEWSSRSTDTSVGHINLNRPAKEDGNAIVFLSDAETSVLKDSFNLLDIEAVSGGPPYPETLTVPNTAPVLKQGVCEGGQSQHESTCCDRSFHR